MKVLVNFIQDRSGSMQSVWDETLNGFRTFVQNLQQDKSDVEYSFTLTAFDTVVETPILDAKIQGVDVDILKSYGPRGSTALYDAVGITLDRIKNVTADKYIVVIVTDGHENSSREWTKTSLQKAIEEKINQGNWTFTYLGTQPETWDDAAAFGVHAGSVSCFDPLQSVAAYQTVSSAVMSMSASDERGTQNLMRDYVSDKDASLAGMRKKPFRSGGIGSGVSDSAMLSKPRTSKSDKKWR